MSSSQNISQKRKKAPDDDNEDDGAGDCLDSSQEEEVMEDYAGQSDDGERICRFCFDGEDDEDLNEETSKSSSLLIAPCVCKGGQKYIHLSCLRRWQRMVLVSQPTHPDFWEEDERHTRCNVCKSEFTCPPPTREELMLGFTGPEIAALIQPGCIIASHESFNRTIDQQMARNPFLARLSGADNWFRGVYLINDVQEDDGGDKTIEWPIDDETDVHVLFRRLNTPAATAPTASSTYSSGDGGHDSESGGHELPFLETADRSIRYVLDPSGGILEGRTDVGGHENSHSITETYLKDLLLANLPCQLVFHRRSTTDGQDDDDERAGRNLNNFKDDKVSAVNLTRPFEPSGRLKERAEKVIQETKTQHTVRVKYYKGGPCQDDRVVSCLVLGGRRRGYTVVKSFRTALLMAKRNAMRAVKNDKGQYIAVGQQVVVEGLCKRPDLNGAHGFVQSYDQEQGRFEVLLLSQPSQQQQTTTCDRNKNTDVDSMEVGNISANATKSIAMVVEPQQHQQLRRGAAVVVRVKPSNLRNDGDEKGKCGTVLAFAGDARWTRVQLLGEIAKTSWGLCQGQISDVLFSPSDKLYDSVVPRLVYAPLSEMSRQNDDNDDDDGDDSDNDLAVLRRVAIEADRYVRGEDEGEESD
mmetsp:Transcript_52142/g.125917  ORF Transcript_52142/g.125917 Transcript_52142/m.125917 type:complete len:639 (-) Transcript_52142:224-2140(-)